MTREEFRVRYRGRLLLLMTEAWACRREEPSALGLLLDRHHMECRRLLDEIYDTLTNVEAPHTNGVATNVVLKGGR